MRCNVNVDAKTRLPNEARPSRVRSSLRRVDSHDSRPRPSKVANQRAGASPLGTMTASPRIRNRASAVGRSLDSVRIVAVAAEIADAEGLPNLTMTRVAARLGVSPQTLYRRVEGYDDLLRGLALRRHEMLAQKLGDAAVGRSGRDAVTAVSHAWREMARDHPGIGAAADRCPCSGDPEIQAAVERIHSVLGNSLRAYDLSHDDETYVVRALCSTLHGFSHLESGDGHPLPHHPDETFERLIDLLCAGIEQLCRNARQHAAVAP